MTAIEASDTLDKAHRFDECIGWMRAAGEPTRIRLLALLDRLDLTVSELIEILDQSQPRVSRHLKLLVEAGLTERFQEGAWAYFRTVDDGAARAFLDGVLKPLARSDDPVLRGDLQRLQDIQQRRSSRAQGYFAKNAEQWSRIRSLHVEEQAVEEAMLSLGLAGKPQTVLDLGTGTGRILQLFAPHVRRGVGIDTSHDMLAVARASLAAPEAQHLQVRHQDVYSLVEGDRFDLVVLHQVLHFLEDPALALRHAKRRLAAGGRVLIVDFLPHDFDFLREEHAHRRLGMSRDQVERWLSFAGLKLEEETLLPGPKGDEADLTVALWTASHADGDI